MKLICLSIFLASAALAAQPENMAVMTGTNAQVIIGKKTFRTNSGASAGTFIQDTSFTEPAMVVQRTGTSGSSTTTPTVAIKAGFETQSNTPIVTIGKISSLHGDVAIWGDSSISAYGGIYDGDGGTKGRLSVDNAARSLRSTDGSTSMLSWGSGTVLVNSFTIQTLFNITPGATSTLLASHISNATVAGRAILTAADAAAQRTALGLGTASVLNVAASGNAASGEVVKGNDTRLLDSTAAGRALLTATDAAAQRTALGVQAAPVHAAISGTSISLASSGVYYKAISEDTTFTFSGAANGAVVTFEVTATGDYQPTFPAEAIWPGGSMPVQTGTSTAVYQFTVINGAIRATATQY